MAEESDVAANDPVDQPKAPRKRAAPKAPPKAKATPDEIAADIERTREELAETLDAIADKVSPKRVAKRTTKKVTNAVKDTAHDAAEAVRDTASSAKEKVTGGTSTKAATAWAPDPGPDAATVPVEVVDHTAERPEVSALPTPPPTPIGVSSVPALPAPGPAIKPEYIVAGAAVGLLAFLLLRRRRRS